MLKRAFPLLRLSNPHNLILSQRTPLLALQQRSIISNFFVSPVIQEREDKRIAISDTKEIFKRIENEHQFLNYPQAVEIFSDLAYIVIPFDKTQREFQQLISRLKILLQNQSGMVKLHGLIDGCIRLGVESLNTTIKNKVEEGNYSRSPEDLCTLFYFLAHQFHHQSVPRDGILLTQVLRDFRHMQFQSLKMENIQYLLSGLKLATEPQTQSALKEPIGDIIQEFTPRLMQATFHELTRCKMEDIILLLTGFSRLWDRQVFSQGEMKQVYQQCEMYLLDYLGKSKKDITGSEFATLIEALAFAVQHSIHTFDPTLIHRLQHIFLNDNAELYHFSYKDLHKILKGFETLNQYFNRTKVISMIVQLVLEAESYEDLPLLHILQTFLQNGLMEQHQDLAVKARVYFQERFQFMERGCMLEYLELFKELGLLFEDKEVMQLISDQFANTFHEYELKELMKIYKLISYNFYREEQTLKLLEDAVKIRTSEPDQRSQVSVQSLKDLLEGLKLHLSFNKRLNSSLTSLLKHSPHLLAQDKVLLVQYLSYLSDFNLPLEEEKLHHYLSLFENDWTPQDLAYLHLYYPLPEALHNKLVQSHQTIEDFDLKERLALNSLATLDPTQVQAHFTQTFTDSNVTEVIEQLLKSQGKDYTTRQILAGGRVKAAFLIENKLAVDIVDHQVAYYQETVKGVRKLRTKGRRAEEIVKKEGLEYRVISLVEMDFVKNEDAFLRSILFDQ